MTDLIETCPNAKTWMTDTLAANEAGVVFGRFAQSVIWSDDADVDGALLVPLDPHVLVADINANPYPLLLRHDPGKPLGKVVSAKVFEHSSGRVFVAAVLGFYEGAPNLGFAELGLEPLADAPSPEKLPALPAGVRFQLTADPRDVDPALLDDLVCDAPIPIDFHGRSHNAAEAAQTFLGVSVIYLALVWNPFVTTFANEASKDAYGAVRTWLKKVLSRMAKCRNPVVEIQSFHADCHISFMFRNRDVARQYRALDALDGAAARAAHLVARMRAADMPPIRLIYEFHATDELWYPSYAELNDGRLVSDNATLIAAEKLPSGLSLGIGLQSLPKAGDS